MCDRRAVLKRTNAPGEPPTPRLKRLWWMGKEIENAILHQVAARFSEAGHRVQFIANNAVVEDEEYGLHGRPDALLLIDQRLVAWELKSINSNAFTYKDLPYLWHVTQLATYLTFPSEYGLPVEGRIIYWSRDDARTEEHVITPSEALRNAVKVELLRLRVAYERVRAGGDLPAVLPLVAKKVKGETFLYKTGPKRGLPKMELNKRCTFCPFFKYQCIPGKTPGWEELKMDEATEV